MVNEAGTATEKATVDPKLAGFINDMKAAGYEAEHTATFANAMAGQTIAAKGWERLQGLLREGVDPTKISDTAKSYTTTAGSANIDLDTNRTAVREMLKSNDSITPYMNKRISKALEAGQVTNAEKGLISSVLESNLSGTQKTNLLEYAALKDMTADEVGSFQAMLDNPNVKPETIAARAESALPGLKDQADIDGKSNWLGLDSLGDGFNNAKDWATNIALGNDAEAIAARHQAEQALYARKDLTPEFQATMEQALRSHKTTAAELGILQKALTDGQLPQEAITALAKEASAEKTGVPGIATNFGMGTGSDINKDTLHVAQTAHTADMAPEAIAKLIDGSRNYTPAEAGRLVTALQTYGREANGNNKIAMQTDITKVATQYADDPALSADNADIKPETKLTNGDKLFGLAPPVTPAKEQGGKEPVTPAK